MSGGNNSADPDQVGKGFAKAKTRMLKARSRWQINKIDLGRRHRLAGRLCKRLTVRSDGSEPNKEREGAKRCQHYGGCSKDRRSRAKRQNARGKVSTQPFPRAIIL